MFAVFHKNKFVNFWLNQYGDEAWIDRTIPAMGWNPNDVQVIWIENFSGLTTFSFDLESATKDIIPIERRIEKVEQKDGSFKDVEVIEANLARKIQPKQWFKNGKKEKDFTDMIQTKK